MRLTDLTILLLSILLFSHPIGIWAQEENAVAAQNGKHYLDLRLKSIDKYNSRLERQQQQMLKKLKKKEKKFADKVKNTDSLAYARYKQQRPTYDSISRVKSTDSSTIAAAKKLRSRSKVIDSLKGIESFVQQKSDNAYPNSAEQNNYTASLSKEQKQLNYHTYINDLIAQRTKNLKSLFTSSNIPGLKGIDKVAFYGKAKMNVYKQMEEDPSKAEDKAMEYLDGTEGFDSHMDKVTTTGGTSMQGLSSGAGKSDLEKMGFQTKGQLQSSLQQKMGASMPNVAQNISKQIGDYQSKLKDIKGDINAAKDTKQSMQKIGNIDKPSFKVNPMRGLPLSKRIERQLNWQMTRATLTGTPAILEGSTMAGFKHTPKLTYGAGIASAIGLGQNWSNIHFSLQGIGLRTFATWQWQYGIGAYAGYERMYKQAVFINSAEAPASLASMPHNTNIYSESLLAGLTKNYRINSKWNGQMQVLYDVWWLQKGLLSPVILRFATIKK